LFVEEDGWVIVDFMTDSVAEEKLQPFIDFYSPHVQVYASDWWNTLRYKVKEEDYILRDKSVMYCCKKIKIGGITL